MMRVSYPYRRLTKFNIQEMLPLIQDENIHHIVFNDPVIGDIQIKVTGMRLRTFGLYGVSCVRCGMVGTYFALESQKKAMKQWTSNDGWHLNLYGADAKGRQIMMTSDHIHPVSKGGSDSLLNRQPMCDSCNSKKGDDDVDASEARLLLFREANRAIYTVIANCEFGVTPTKLLDAARRALAKKLPLDSSGVQLSSPLVRKKEITAIRRPLLTEVV